MPYRSIELELTDEQLAAIQAIVDGDERGFALLAHPQVRGQPIGDNACLRSDPRAVRTIGLGNQGGTGTASVLGVALDELRNTSERQ